MGNNRLNILIDCHFFDYDFVHGARVYLKGLYSELIKIDDKKFHFFFVACNTENLTNEFGIHDNVSYIKYKFSNKIYRLLFDIPEIIKTYKIDYLHIQYISPFRKTCKEIVTTHDILFNDFPDFFSINYRYISDFLFKRSARRADLLLTVSEYSKKAISKHYNIPLNKIFITPNAPSDYFNRLLSANNIIDIKSKYNLKKYILYVSRIEPRKNHLLVMKSYCELKLWEDDFYLIFIGKINKVSKEYTFFLNSLDKNIKAKILHIDQVSNEELVSFYKHADLFIYPSLAEGFGIPPLEAALSGTPCLCSNATAMQDFSFFNDRVFNPSDKEELKNKILKILKNNDIAENKRIQEFVMNNYQWKRIADDFFSLLSKKVELK